MGLFDFLIEPGKVPIENMEYILMRDWTYGEDLENLPLKAGTIVHTVTVKQNKEGVYQGYDFIVKDTNVKGHTNYPWILAENTENNRERIKFLRKKEDELKNLTRAIRSLQYAVDTLQNHLCGDRIIGEENQEK